jgi:hypothetical protein
MATIRIFMLWVIGALLIVPYAIYRLLSDATRDEYAFLIVVPLFWIFGFWGVVAPLLMAVRVRRLFRALETAGSAPAVRDALENNEAEGIVVDLIARENGLPKFVARRLYAAVRARFDSEAGV